ncbi:MAG: FAD-dependent oxidoreductase [Acidobacteria bacterium]|nr:FAD-dependent oxidoreductase [Acidobacteriota bacterium]
MATDTKKEFRRRDLIKAAAMGAGVAALTGLKSEQTKAAEEVVDLLIVGAGNSGLPAAIQAADLGVKVILVDKNTAIGGMLHISSGQFSGANTKWQISKGIEDSPQKHYRDALRIGRYKANSELLKLAVENAAAMVDWLQSIGVELKPESPFFAHEHELYSVPRTYQGVAEGRTLLEAFRKQLDKRIERGDVQLVLGATVTNLIKDKDGRIIGVGATDESGTAKEFHAHAVILATGGYGANQELIKKYNPKYQSSLPMCLPHATGDGIVMAQQAGAKLTHMEYFIPIVGVIEDPKAPDRALLANLVLLPPAGFSGSIWVNKLGERFINEDTIHPDERERAILKQPDVTIFVIFDEKIKNENHPAMWGWTKEKFEQEASRGGMIKRASSIDDLAREIGVDASPLKESISRYNGHIGNKLDPDFGRERLKYKLEQPPFYAIRMVGTTLITMGGIKVNHSLQVEDENGKVIPGLYAVGETLGCAQIMGDGLCSGMSVGPAMTLGRIVARNAYQYVQRERLRP